MSMRELKTRMREEAMQELNRANEKFPLFNGRHEAMAVIAEEYEETAEALEELEVAVKTMWEDTKKNRPDSIKPLAIAELAINMACEAIRTAAMLLKMEMSLGITTDDIDELLGIATNDIDERAKRGVE